MTTINQALDDVRSKVNKRVGNGQCYGLVAYYVNLLNGPRMGAGIQDGPFDGIGDTINAHAIETGYDWKKFGWNVTYPRAASDFKVGVIINIKPNQGAPFWTGQHGHTAIVTAVTKHSITLHEQNTWGREWVVEQVYTLDSNFIKMVDSLVYKPEVVSKTSGSFKVRVSIDDLNIRAGAGLNHKVKQVCKKGVYTITETKFSDGFEWGKLKSGIGWIALKYTLKI